MNTEFKELGLSKHVLESIDVLGYDKPSDIQTQMIPLIMKGTDLIGQAQTGTGKTLAYAASILSKINIDTKRVVRAIILTPTRELALQVSEEFSALNTSSNFDILAVYGGSSITEQLRALKRGVDIVVGTPGRVMDLIKRKALIIDKTEYFVLDEADEMLDMGFLEDIESVLKSTNDTKQVLMLSATMPNQIKKLAEKYMKKDYKHIVIKSDSKTAVNVSQSYYLVSEKTREEILCRILDLKNSKRSIIFCRTKRDCDELLSSLSLRGYNAEAMHGDIAQAARIKTLDRFKHGAFKILIATDVAARGIHVDDIEVVINYKLPEDFESYIHRIGRTGRAGETGEAISLVTNRDLNFLKGIEKFANCKIDEKLVPTKEEIVKLKYQEILNDAFDLKKGGNNAEALEYVRDLNKADLMNLAASLLQREVNSVIGANLDKKIEVVQKQTRGSSVKPGTVRVFVNIGKKDGLKRDPLFDFINKVTGVSKKSLYNLEILQTFTFIDIDKKDIDRFMRNIQNTRYAGRSVRAEKAKKQN